MPTQKRKGQSKQQKTKIKKLIRLVNLYKAKLEIEKNIKNNLFFYIFDTEGTEKLNEYMSIHNFKKNRFNS